MSEILTLIKCLPVLLGLLQELGKFLKLHCGDNPEKFLTDAHEVFSVLNGAKSSEEKIDAARKLQGLLTKL